MYVGILTGGYEEIDHLRQKKLLYQKLKFRSKIKNKLNN